MKKYSNILLPIKIVIFSFFFIVLMANQNIKAQYYQFPVFDSIALIPEVPVDSIYMKLICYTNHFRSDCYLDSTELHFTTPDKFRLYLFFSTDSTSMSCTREDTINLLPPAVLFDGNYNLTVYLMTFSSIDTIVDTISTSFTVSSDPVDLKDVNNIKSLNLFPIPASNRLNFILKNNSKPIKLEIFDLTGKRVKTKEYINQSSEFFNGSIVVSALKEGVYFCRFSVGGKQITRKFIKQ